MIRENETISLHPETRHCRKCISCLFTLKYISFHKRFLQYLLILRLLLSHISVTFLYFSLLVFFCFYFAILSFAHLLFLSLSCHLPLSYLFLLLFILFVHICSHPVPPFCFSFSAYLFNLSFLVYTLFLFIPFY